MISVRVALLVSLLAPAVVVGATAGMGGCGSSDNAPGGPEVHACQDVFTMCTNNPPTLADNATCSTILSGPCSNSAIAYRSCVTGLCTDAGFTDLSAIQLQCVSYTNALESCLAAESDGGATSGSSGGEGVVDSGSTTIVTIPSDAGTHDH
jgi:hypothetical protein